LDRRKCDEFLDYQVSMRVWGLEREIWVFYFKRLGIPVLHSFDGGHSAEIVRQFVQFLHTMSQAHGEFL